MNAPTVVPAKIGARNLAPVMAKTLDCLLRAATRSAELARIISDLDEAVALIGDSEEGLANARKIIDSATSYD